MTLTRTPTAASDAGPAPAPTSLGRLGRLGRLIEHTTSRRGAWLTLLIALVVAGAVLGGLRSDKDAAQPDALPAGAESRVAAELQQRFPGADRAAVLVLWQRPDGGVLTGDQLALIRSQAPAAAAAVGAPAVPPTVSEDGRAALVPVPVDVDRPNSEVATTVHALRAVVHESAPAGVEAFVTGGPAFGADVASAFDGADLTLLLVTIGVIVVLLLLTYRSPVLWVVPLTVVAFADQVAGVLTTRAALAWDLQFDAGIISVLVLGAGTNYALLLISRYREVLREEPDHRRALGHAWRGTLPAIVASNVTVVVSLLALVLAAMPATSGLGIAAAIGLVVALLFAVVVLPAALAVVGRGVFWPFVPRPGVPASRGSVWGRFAAAGMRRPAATVGAVVAVLGLLAVGVAGTRVGLAQTERFRVAAESQAGATVLAAHFSPGASAPLAVIAPRAVATELVDALERVPGVDRVTRDGSSGGLVRLDVVGRAAPGTPEADRLVEDVRSAARAESGGRAIVGGQSAELLDQREAAARDLRVVAPAILGVVLIVLVLLLRAFVAPVVLVAVNVLSALAAIGLGSWVGRGAFGFAGLDVNVPLLSFMFLVALGVDYTIFLVHRTRQEATAHGTVEGMRRAVSATGAVITSAGVVLAAVFAALGVLPLMVLAQLGLIVGLGVLLDTFVVRTLLVPAVFALLGDRMWWPGRAVR